MRRSLSASQTRSSSGADRQRAVGPAADQSAPHARPAEDPLDLGDGRLGAAAIGQQGQPGEAVRRVLDVLGQPVVVGADHRQVVLGVLVGDDRVRQPRRRIQHLGIDAVAVHLGEADLRVVAAAAHVLEAAPALHLLGLEAGAGVHAEVDRLVHALDDPGVALVEALDARRAVAQAAGTRAVQRSPGSLT